MTGAVAAIPASMAFVLGAVLASTDPVAVSALGRRLSLPARVQALVQAESLFNDATSLVLVPDRRSIAVAGTAGTTAAGCCCTAPGSSRSWRRGRRPGRRGRGRGVAVRRRVTDPVLETVVALITPYAAYVLGAAAHVSPVMAVIVAGLAIGARREKITTAQTRLQLHSVYQTVIFLLESVVFSLIGLQLPTLIRALFACPGIAGRALAVAGTLIATRILSVSPLSAVLQRRGASRARPGRSRGGVLGWHPRRGAAGRGPVHSPDLGQRGTAAAAGPDPGAGHRGHRRSLITQGLTLEPLARFTGIARPADAAPRGTVARLRLAEAGLARLDDSPAVTPPRTP